MEGTGFSTITSSLVSGDDTDRTSYPSHVWFGPIYICERVSEREWRCHLGIVVPRTSGDSVIGWRGLGLKVQGFKSYQRPLSWL